MGKVYQPAVIEKTNEIINILTETNFFKDYELEKKDYAINFLNDKLTEKFIEGKIDDDNLELFELEEFELILRDIVAGTILNELKDKGYLESYEDDNTEELFFLTEMGKKFLQERGTFY
jgi:hypothetical protein